MHVPGWHDETRELQAAGQLQMVGIIQEQHPDRARLFMQWKQMEWPVLVDSLNLLGVGVVPITLAIDEHGIIRAINPRRETIEQEFLSKTFAPPAAIRPAAAAAAPAVGPRPAPEASADAWRSYGERLFLWGDEERWDDVVEAFGRAAEHRPDAGAVHFRLGTAHRARYDSASRRPGDFRQAVASWQRALDLDPNQYIWRRRIQQYGPRLDKPYPFYDWVPEARAAIEARGKTPVPLRVEPAGAEFAKPVKTFAAADERRAEPDPDGRIYRDPGELIEVETLSVPSEIAPGAVARAHVVLRPKLERKAHWNNEVDELVVWVEPPAGWAADAHYLTVPLPAQAVSQETRRVEFELRSPADAGARGIAIPGYALYYVCEDIDGTCLYRRQDFAVRVEIR